jgi:hypothetical protein
MIKICENQLDKFKKHGYEYLYYVMKGVYLAFDKDTKEYMGIDYFYQPKSISYTDSKCEKMLKKLISLGVLEIIED